MKKRRAFERLEKSTINTMNREKNDCQEKMIEEIRKGVNSLVSYSGFNFIALIMMTSTVIGITKSCSRTAELLKRTQPLEVITRDVIGGQELERFYVVNGIRTYSEIDGKPVESYFPKKYR